MKGTDGKRLVLCMVAVLVLALLPAFAGSGDVAPAISQESQAQGQAAAAPASPQGHVWLDADGNPLPFQTEDEIVNFLRTAKIKKSKEIGTGITVPMKALLEKDGVRVNAKFSYIEAQKPKAEFATGRIEFQFRDSYQYETAAYEVGRLLGLTSVPPTVNRKGWDQSGATKSGAMQIWIEKTFTEFDRKEKRKIEAPDQTRWNYQMWEMHVFDALIQNTDRSLPNVLIDPEWKVWMIDHTRAFRRNPVENIQLLQHCERGLLEKLRTLDEAAARARLKDYLQGGEIDALLKRRAELVAHFEKLIQEKGEGAVLYSFNE